jgi:chemotaxis protein CheX
MQATIEINCEQVDIPRVVGDVFRTMLGLDVTESRIAGWATPGSLTAAVQFVGAWKGAVLLLCGPQQAFAFTSRLMPGLHPTRVDEDVRDALGELANMVGGNLKSVLPRGVALSMPSVVVGNDYALHICGGNLSRTVAFSSDVGDFWVTLVQVLDKET